MNAGVRQPFPDDSSVVRAFVVPFDLGEDFLRGFGVEIVVELVGASEKQSDQGRLVVGYDRENVETDAFGEGGFVEEAIAFDFGESFGNAFWGDGF